MNSSRKVGGLTVGAITFLVAISGVAHEEAVILVGRNAAGELVVDSDFEQPVELPVSIFPSTPGFATGELAFHSTILDEPINDFFQLSTAADFQFILLAKDTGMEIWNGSAFMQINEAYPMGPSPFDAHPIWNIVNGTPGNSYSVTLKLRDTNGIYPDSDSFVVGFTPALPEFRLSLTPLSAQQVALTWSTNAVGWNLEKASSLTTTNWSTITNVPSVIGTNFTLSLATTNIQQYFRLHWQP